MVPLAQPSLKRKAAEMNRNVGSTGGLFSRQRRQLITYGKKDAKPLSLTANQFRRDPYEIPADDDESGGEVDRGRASSAQAEEQALLQAAAGEEDSESGLSDEPEQADCPADNEPHEPLHVGVTASRPILLSSTSAAATWTTNTASPTPTETPTQRPVHLSDSQRAPKRVKSSSTSKPIQRPVAKPVRRLPVNELVLVASPTDNADFEPPQSSVPGVQTQDPIDGPISQSRKRGVSPIDSRDDGVNQQSTKRPFSTFKRRLQSSKYRYKSITDLREKRAGRSSVQASPGTNRSGDGFDAPELFISPLAKKAFKRRRPRHDPLVLGFGALQLQSGPLPDVKFEPAPSPLKMEATPTSGQQETLGVQAEADTALHSQRSARRVSFGDQARHDEIMAQLSSVSAPPRPRPISDASDDEDEYEDDVGEKDRDIIVDGFAATNDEGDEDDVYEADAEIEDDYQLGEDHTHQEMEPESIVGKPQPVEETPAVSEGVSLDFRQQVPGRRPRRRIRQDSLVEVDEDIVEVAEPTFPSMQQALPNITDHQFPVVASDELANICEPQQSQLRRPRSILKNTSQAIDDETTHARQTAANTRRNSTVELSESRYFTDAADMLRRSDPSKHRIVPRRQRSSYLDDEIEMLDSQVVVPETSLHSLGAEAEADREVQAYSHTNNLAILRRNSEAEWTSQDVLPTVPRDLRTLTRSVSREHGTLSQSMRRRSGMPFQSPRKIRQV